MKYNISKLCTYAKMLIKRLLTFVFIIQHVNTSRECAWAETVTLWLTLHRKAVDLTEPFVGKAVELTMLLFSLRLGLRLKTCNI